jgi:tRNA(Ile)-lysidine synthase
MLDRLTIERMAAKAGDGPILIALSGGGDSVALMHLLKAEGMALRAAVIDHGLRASSAHDAQTAASMAEAAGVAVQIHALIWPPNANRAHEAAREARYAALCRAARASGARVIATGHTRDDQAETVLIRGARHSGLRGLAGMRALAPAPLWPEGRGLWLARPLLRTRRAELRDYLRQRDATWIEDSANADEVYARVRARHALAQMEGERLDPMRLAALAERLVPLAEATDAAALALIERAASFEDDVISIERAAWRGESEVKRRALWALITAAGASQRGPMPAQIAALDGAIETAPFEGFTLAGAWLREKRGRIAIARDRGGLAGRADGAGPLAPLALSPSETVVWDRRVALTMAEPGWSVVVEGGAPMLARGEERAALAAAAPQWLLKDRVQHVLGHD